MRLQILQAQVFQLAQWVVRRGDGDDRIVEEWQEFEAHVLWHHGHDDQVIPVVREAADSLGTVDHVEGQVNLRMHSFEGGKQVRDEVLGARLHRKLQLPL
ncbi:hypothetical protein D3C77_560560 [compost metagenome]